MIETLFISMSYNMSTPEVLIDRNQRRITDFIIWIYLQAPLGVTDDTAPHDI